MPILMDITETVEITTDLFTRSHIITTHSCIGLFKDLIDMSFSARKTIHRIWFVVLFGAVVFYFLNTGTVNSSISLNFILPNGKTGEPLSVGLSIIVWGFYFFFFGILITATTMLFELLLFFPILFRSEVVGKRLFRRAFLPKYSERAQKEEDIGFTTSYIIGFGSAFF